MTKFCLWALTICVLLQFGFDLLMAEPAFHGEVAWRLITHNRTGQ